MPSKSNANGAKDDLMLMLLRMILVLKVQNNCPSPARVHEIFMLHALSKRAPLLA